MSYEDLTSEQGEKLAERQTPEETLALVQESYFYIILRMSPVSLLHTPRSSRPCRKPCHDA